MIRPAAPPEPCRVARGPFWSVGDPGAQVMT